MYTAVCVYTHTLLEYCNRHLLKNTKILEVCTQLYTAVPRYLRGTGYSSKRYREHDRTKIVITSSKLF